MEQVEDIVRALEKSKDVDVASLRNITGAKRLLSLTRVLRLKVLLSILLNVVIMVSRVFVYHLVNLWPFNSVRS